MEDYNVINFTNIYKDDFEGIHHQIKYPVKSGETKPFPKFLADHLANQLAIKILLETEKDWGNAQAKLELTKQILGEIAVKVSVPIIETAKPNPITEQKSDEPFPEAPKDEVKTEEGFKCDVCGKVIKTEQALKMHRGRFHK